MHTYARLLCVLLGLFVPATAADISFWDNPQRGGNSFNGTPPDEAYFRALKNTGASWVRLTFTKWPGADRDFLVGNADRYDGIPPSDLATLRQVMDAAGAADIKVVLVPLTLPGDRWVQHNDNRLDDRLWTDRAYWRQSAAFWRDLATAVKDHPALAGYNLLNEPAPEVGHGLDKHALPAVQKSWYARHRGTPRDLPGFYDFVIAAIRKVDPITPVMVDCGWYANPWNLAGWSGPLADDKVLYATHMYDPYEATSAPNLTRDPPYRYPGYRSRLETRKVTWNRNTVRRFLAASFDWAATHGLPPTRIVTGEFGCMRQWKDCGAYLTDVLDTLNAHGGHWAFYSFREDVWEGMDYEIPANVPPERVYALRKQGKAGLVPHTPHPLMDIIEAHME